MALMRYLQILEAALFALAATMAICLGVVWLMYSFHTDLSSSVGAEMPTVAAATAAFSLLTLFLGLAFWSLIRRPRGQLLIQCLAFIVSALACMYIYNLFTA